MWVVHARHLLLGYLTENKIKKTENLYIYIYIIISKTVAGLLACKLRWPKLALGERCYQL